MTPSDSGAFAARMVGVEEELMLVDPESGVLVPCGQEIVAGTVTASQCAPARGWGPVIKPEFFLETSAAVIFPGRCCSGSSQRLRWRRGEANTDCVGWTASRYFHVGTRRHWALVVRPEGPWPSRSRVVHPSVYTCTDGALVARRLRGLVTELAHGQD